MNNEDPKKCKCNSCYKQLPKAEMVKQYKEGYRCENCHRWWRIVGSTCTVVGILLFLGFIFLMVRADKTDK